MLRLCTLLVTGSLICGIAIFPAAAQTTQPPPPLSEAGPPPAPGPASGAHPFIDEFRAANTTHDGRLTLQQAQAAAPASQHMAMVVRRFAAIDAQHKGYITLQDIRAYRQQLRAARTPPSATN